VPEIHLTAVAPSDFDALVAIRIEAMRESLTRVGRFDAVRARERFTASFLPKQTRYIESGGYQVGFVAVKPIEDGLLLDHLYILPSWQGRGIGAAVLRIVFAEADAQHLSIRVGALIHSASNRFYLRHGFEFVERTEYDNYYVRRARSAD